MKSLSKKLLMTLMILACAVCFVFVGLNFGVAKADIDLKTAITDFNIVESAQVRVGNPSGIRFMAEVDAKEYDALGADAEMGMLIAPVELINDGEELTLETTLKQGYSLMNVKKLQWADASTKDTYVFNAVITNVQQSNLNREFRARAYITLNGQTVYSGSVERSPVYVASAALADGEDPALLSNYFSALDAEGELTTNVANNSVSMYVGDKFSFDTLYDGIKIIPSITIGDSNVLGADDSTARADDVVAKASGSTIITVEFNGKQVEINVTVKKVVADNQLTFENGETGIFNYQPRSGAVPEITSAVVPFTANTKTKADVYFTDNIFQFSITNKTEYNGVGVYYYVSLGSVKANVAYDYSINVRYDGLENITWDGSTYKHNVVMVSSDSAKTIIDKNQDGVENNDYLASWTPSEFSHYTGTIKTDKDTNVYLFFWLFTNKDTTVNVQMDNCYLIPMTSGNSFAYQEANYGGTAYYAQTTEASKLPDGTNTAWVMTVNNHTNASLRTIYRVYGDFKAGKTYQFIYRFNILDRSANIVQVYVQHTVNNYNNHTYIHDLSAMEYGYYKTQPKGAIIEETNQTLSKDANYLEVCFWTMSKSHNPDGGSFVMSFDIQVVELA